MKFTIYHKILTCFIYCFGIIVYTIAQPVADFSASITNGCSPITVQFTDISSGGPAYWYWDFGNGDTSLLQNPVITFSAAGNFTVTLRVTDTSGQQDTEIKSNFIINIPSPVAQFNYYPSSGCIPLDVIFRDQSTTSGGIITSLSWDFGDGAVASNPNPMYTYTDTGQYTVTLIAMNSFGCADTSVIINAVSAGSPPIASFYADPTSTCPADPIIFTNTSQGRTTSWLWLFDDGDTSTRKNPAHFYQDTGYQTVTLIASFYGCPDTFIVPDYVYVKPPFVKIRSAIACESPYTRFFQAKYLGAISYLWSFGDGTVDSVNKFPIHTYAQTGIYTVRLKAWGPECTFMDTVQLYIIDESPSYSFTASRTKICKFDSVTFSATNYNPAFIDSFAWDYGDGTQSNGFSPVNTSSHVYQSSGTFYPVMITQDINGCFDTISPGIKVEIYGPSADFLSGPFNCVDVPANFTDQSTDDGIHPIAQWTWDYGDGSVHTYTTPPFVHAYNNIGTYQVKLNISDANGCIDSIIKPNALTTVAKPVAIFNIADSAVCLKDSVYFSDISPGQALGRTWYFGDGDSSTLINPAHLYKQPGTYTARLVIGNLKGCTDSLDKITSTLPLPIVDAGLDSVICQGQTITLQPSGASTYTWVANAGLSCTFCTNPAANPIAPTRFYVTGTDTAGCSENDSVYIQVKQPFNVAVNAGIDSICVGSSVQLTATGAELYSWQPSTGLNSTTSSTPVATPAATTIYTVVGSDTRNCFTDTSAITIAVSAFPQFNIIDTNVTVAAGSNFQIKTANSSDIINWQWTPPTDLSCTNCPQPFAKANKIIQYKGVATNSFGCSVSDVITIKGLCNTDVIFIPNTFSPNSDNINDWFYPRGNGLYMVKSMRIFNRLGQLVFQKLNFPADVASQGWDGKYFSKTVPQDVYVYFIEIICNNGITVTFKGDVTVL